MIKLKEIFQEGALQLTSDERNQVEAMLPDIIKVISGKYIGDNMKKQVGDINAVSADKTPIKVGIYVGNNLYNKNADAYYQTNDKNNPDDNEILIQQFHFSSYFKGLSGLDMKLTKIATGNENTGIERLRKVLKHELIHAKDPAVNQRYMNEPYSYNPEIYYKSWTEFQTMTGQFFEAITTGVDRAFQLGMSKDEVLKALNNILEYYSGKTKSFNQEAKDFIQGSGKRNIFQSLINFFIKLPSSIDDYATYIASIKKYNPEGYKEFLGDLYKTVDQARDRLKTLKEMEYISEVKRFQKIAGILITESQINDNFIFEEVSDDAIEKAIAKVVKVDPSKIDLDKLEKGEAPEEKDLKEFVGLAITIAGLLPAALELVGGTTNWVKQNFALSDQEKKYLENLNTQIKNKKIQIDKADKANAASAEEKYREELEDLIKTKNELYGTKFGNKMKDWGHKLHHAYTWPIRKMLYGIAMYEKLVGRNSKEKLSKLQDKKHREKVANIIYAVIMMSIAGVGVASHIKHLAGVGPVLTTIADGVKGGKSAQEIIQGISALI